MRRRARCGAWVAGSVLILCLLVVGWWLYGAYGDRIPQGLEQLGRWGRGLGDYPVLLYVLLVVLPAFPVPLSPFIALAGIVYGDILGVVPGGLLTASAIGLNIFWCYFLTAGPVRHGVLRILHRFGYRIPEIPPGKALQFALLVRVTPIFPLCVQNYILGLMRVPFRSYLLGSWSTQVPLAFIVAVTGGAIFAGNVTLIVAAVCLLLLVFLVLRWTRGRLQEDQELNQAQASIRSAEAPGKAAEGGIEG